MSAVHLIRHAKAKSRLEWSEPDEARPLTKRGRREAHGLADRLRDEALARVEVLALRVLADRLEHGESVPELTGLFHAA